MSRDIEPLPTDKFQVGDRVVLNERGRVIWPDFTTGLGTVIKKIDGTGAGNRGREDHSWGVRFDDYGDVKYKTPGNSHIVSASAIEFEVEVSDEDVADAIRSILGKS